MVRLIAGDDLALNELMERWQKPLHSFILRYVGNYADSIELAQETFVRVYHHRSRFNFKSKFSTWLLSIATNLCRHHARWHTRHRTISLDDTASFDKVPDEDLLISPDEIPSAQVGRSELAKLVKEEIAKQEYASFSRSIVRWRSSRGEPFLLTFTLQLLVHVQALGTRFSGSVSPSREKRFR